MKTFKKDENMKLCLLKNNFTQSNKVINLRRLNKLCSKVRKSVNRVEGYNYNWIVDELTKVGNNHHTQISQNNLIVNRELLPE